MSEAADLERWSRSLLTAPDDRFFRIMRTYLGNVKTPFNKHSLIKRLGALFRSEEVSDRMISLIDARDAQTLSAIALLDEPTAPRLFQLFEGDIEYLKLHYHIMNLEERMLVYRDEEDDRRIRFNPILKHTIELEVLDPALIFPISKATAKPSHLDWPSDSRLLGLAAFLSSAHSLFKSDGSLRKKAAEEISIIFGASGGGTEYVMSTLGALLKLGVLRKSGTGYQINHSSWHAFCELESDSRRSHIVGAASASLAKGLDRTRASEAVFELIHSMPEDVAFDEETLGRLLRTTAPFEESHTDAITNSLLDLGVIASDAKGRLSKATATEREVPANVFLLPTGELDVPLDIDLSRCWFIPLVADLRRFDTHSTFEITRHSSIRAFEAGLGSEEINRLLDDLAGPVPQNLQTSLGLWEEEYRSIRIRTGTIVSVDESRRHLFDYDRGIQELITETVAPGVYLVRTQDIPDLTKILEASGIDHVPKQESADDSTIAAQHSASAFPEFNVRGALKFAIPKRKTTRKRLQRSDYEEELRGQIKPLSLTREQEAEFEDRLARRIIVVPEQLTTLSPATESVEAKGFDYLGKVRLIQQAISSKHDLLEIIGPGESEPTIVKPDELEKENDELVLAGRSLEDVQLRIRVRTIGFLRKRRGSYFG